MSGIRNENLSQLINQQINKYTLKEGNTIKQYIYYFYRIIYDGAKIDH